LQNPKNKLIFNKHKALHAILPVVPKRNLINTPWYKVKQILKKLLILIKIVNPESRQVFNNLYHHGNKSQQSASGKR
jgi:hypothetical protein